MRCHDARTKLLAQREGGLKHAEHSELQEHLDLCSACRAFELYQQRLDLLLHSSAPQPKVPTVTPTPASPSTVRIMQAVQQQRNVSRQLADIRFQQHSRLASWQKVGTPLAALIFFTLGSIPLLILAIAIIQPDLFVQILGALGNVVDVLVLLSQYLQNGLILMNQYNWVSLGLAFVLVVMLGMWLRLMRHPQET